MDYLLKSRRCYINVRKGWFGLALVQACIKSRSIVVILSEAKNLVPHQHFFVIPAQAGIQQWGHNLLAFWDGF
jgi:hypothetical protein